MALDSRQEAYPVLAADGTPLGVVTADQITAVPAALRPSTRIGDISTPMVWAATAGPREPLSAVLARSVGDRPVLVLLDGRVVGVLTPADVAAALRRSVLGERLPVD